jgi:hypothetical protein
VAVAWLLCSSYSYSSETDIVYGTTQNAASDGLMWVMSNVLPQQAGLIVNGVIYRYTTEKDPNDPLLVHVQNENARGDGYIFRETDDWSGLAGNTINKRVPVSNIDISYWGDGSIQTEGFGTVKDASVQYLYQFNPCFDPQSRPDCPGYKDPFILELGEVEVVDPLDDDLIQDELDRKATLEDEEQEEIDREKVKSEKKSDERLDKILGIVNQALMAAEAQAKHEQLMAMAALPTSYVATQISGGTYEETIVLKDKKLPENRNALRNNLAQQLKHQEMVNLQYEIEK